MTPGGQAPTFESSAGTVSIKAIETRYAGCRFRSRLEARWAVFFDTLGVRWEHEHEGYEMPDGTRYLPDFWLPSMRVWFEVKPELQPIDVKWRSFHAEVNSEHWFVPLDVFVDPATKMERGIDFDKLPKVTAPTPTRTFMGGPMPRRDPYPRDPDWDSAEARYELGCLLGPGSPHSG